jgi:hypothetical protein
MANSFFRFVSSFFGASDPKRDESEIGTAKTTGLVKATWPDELQALFIEPSGSDVAKALDGWNWIGLDGLEPAAVSAFGDIFLRAADGSIHHLDMIEGRLTPLSPNWTEFAAMLQNTDSQDDLLLAGLVIAMRKKGLILAAGQCYDFQNPPILGGEMSVGQIEKTLFVVKVHIAGQIHRQVKDLPPGAKINKVTISDR